MERFAEVYYGAAPKITMTRVLAHEQVAKHVRTLETVIYDIGRHYASGKAKPVLTKLKAAIKSLQTWAAM